MLQISKHQMDVLQYDLDRRYADELITHIRQTKPEIIAIISDDVIRRRITEILPVARGYGIYSDSSTAQIGILAAAIGPEFLDKPDVKHFLEAPEPTADAKVEMLCGLLSESLST